jgi:glycine hydroxymethyltransferase
LKSGGFDIVSGGTDSHIVLLDLRPKKLTGNVVEKVLEEAGMTCNKNAVPFDPEKPMVTSGVRLGTPAATTRGFGEAEWRQVGQMINTVLDGLAKDGVDGNKALEKEVREKVRTLCARFPIYTGL